MTHRQGWHVGIDIGGTHVRLVADTGDGTRLPVLRGAVPDSYPALLRLIRDLLDKAAATRLDRGAVNHGAAPAAVACGLPGTSNGERPVFIPALPWLQDEPLAADLAQIAGAPATLALDGHLTLLAEAAEGAARGCNSAVLVAVGTGIGGALMVGGRIWRGTHGSAGSWGWLTFPGMVDDPVHGQFEQAAAGRALDVRAAQFGTPGPDAGAALLTGADLVARARAGDPAAVAQVSAYASDLGRGLAALASVLDPEVVLVAGGLSAAMDVLGPAIGKVMAQAASPGGQHVPVRPAGLGPDGGIVGAWLAARGGTDLWV